MSAGTYGVRYQGFSIYDLHLDKATFCIDIDGNAGIGVSYPATMFSVNNKAGFTEEGYLWCTTQRGDTVMLIGTSNGMALWEDYTPPQRREEIKDAWAEKNLIRPMPEESSQDEPETKQ